jgi:hypothetical protein
VLIQKDLAAAAVPAVLAGVDALLQSHRFRRVLSGELKDGRRLWRWDRDRRWAVDRVEALYRAHAPEDLSINLIATLRLAAEREVTMDGIPTYFLSGRLLMFDFPLLQALRLRQPERIAARLIAETTSALPWLENYSTAAKCLVRLASAERNGVGIGTPVHAEAVSLLETENNAA